MCCIHLLSLFFLSFSIKKTGGNAPQLLRENGERIAQSLVLRIIM
jgi:hypothetical protein